MFFCISEELRDPNMRKWAWSIYGKSSLRENKSQINIKYEKRVLANLNKRLNRIEKEKLKINDSYSDISSHIDAHHVVNEKGNSTSMNKSSLHSHLFIKLKDFKANVNILNNNSRKNLRQNVVEHGASKIDSKDSNISKQDDEEISEKNPKFNLDLTTLEENEMDS